MNYNNNSNNSTSAYNHQNHHNNNVNRQSTTTNHLSSPHPGLNLNPNTLTPQQQAILQQAHLIQQQQAILQAQHQSTTSNHSIPTSIPQSHSIPSQQQPPPPPPNQHQISQHQAMIQQQQLILQQQQQRQIPRTPVSQLPQQSNPSSIPNPQNIKRSMPAFNDVIGPNQAYTRAKRNKPTDRRLPNLIEGSKEFQKLKNEFIKLQTIEEKIDWTISRKRLELEDSLKKTLSVKRTMRIKIWNSVEGQSWQRVIKEDEQMKEVVEKDQEKEVVEKEKEKEIEKKDEEEEEGEKKTVEEGVEGTDDKGEPTSESNQEKIEQKEKQTKEIDTLSSIEAVPKWTLHIEGMLLDHPTSSETKETLPKIIETKRPFSSLITGLLIKVERPDELYPEPNFVEWQKTCNSNLKNEFSKFKFKRNGSENCKIKLAFHLNQFPQRLKLMPILGDFLNLKEASLIEIMNSLWNYIKKERLQDSIDKRNIKKDHKLACLFPPMCDKMPFHQLTDSVRRFIGMSEPVCIEYEIDVEEGCEGKVKYYDVEFNIEDPAKLHMLKVKESLDGQDQISKEIISLDEQIMESIAKIKEIKIKRDFYLEFSKDPITFLKRWIKSQSEDLNELLGLKEIEKFKFNQSNHQDWLNEAIKVYQLREFNSKVNNHSSISQLNSNQLNSNGSIGNINHPIGSGFGGLNSMIGQHGINQNINQIRR